MKLEFIGAAHEVTGSCHFIHWQDKSILVDCGMEQGPDIYENQELPVQASEIDYVFVTHAHIDHSGLLPLLAQKGFQGQIFATDATTQLCQIMLKDSAHIQEFEAEWKNRKGKRAGNPLVEPMYTMTDAEKALTLFVPCPYNEILQITEGLKVRFRDAGHLLGSAFIELWLTEGEKETKLVFSGDLGNGNRPLIKDPAWPTDADYLIIESTYGNRNHEAVPDYTVPMSELLERTFARGGNVVIPAFSVGRTQEMLYHLRRIKENNMVHSCPDFEVYVDSPLAVEATTIFNRNVLECFREESVEMIKCGKNPIGFDGLKTSLTSDDSRAINFNQKPKVIISASGMCEAGRIRHHLKHNLWRKECSILFVGYQVPGTLGYNLLHGAQEVKLFGEKVQVNAEIVNLPGISGHADRDHLTEWVGHMHKMPKRIFVVHGEDQVTDEFATHLAETFHINATAPYSGDVFDLDSDLCVCQGDRKPAEARKKKPAKAAATAFAKLLEAGNRLIAIIHKNQGLANKDMARFTSQIQSLCDKWDRTDL